MVRGKKKEKRKTQSLKDDIIIQNRCAIKYYNNKSIIKKIKYSDFNHYNNMRF